MDLKDRVALITGGGTGLGRAIGLALAAEGVHVAVNYSRSEAEARDTVKELGGRGVQAMAVRADVSQSGPVDAMVQAVLDRFGHIDILVNNAGTTAYVPIEDLAAMTEEKWDRILDVNAKGTFLCSRAVGPLMRAQGAGKIINTASNSGVIPEGSSLAYCVSKAAVLMLTQCLARALAPQVQVNALAPGFMLTRWFDTFFTPEQQQRHIGGGPVVSVEEVAAAAVLLARSDHINGHTLVIDGGEVLHIKP